MVHFIGIKGSGMASLACILHDLHEEVNGSDIEKYIFTQKALEDRGIKITPFDENNIHENDVVIIGNAFDEKNVEVAQAKKMKNVTCYYYHEYLGQLLQKYVSVCIAGTHGKTTTTGMMAHLLSTVDACGYLIGDGSGEMPEGAKYFVLESCEYQRHFLAYHPDYAIITNIDLDHVDYYKDIDDYCSAFLAFSNQVKKACIVFGDDPHLQKMPFTCPIITYGCQEGNDVLGYNFEEDENGMRFDVKYKGQFFGHFDFPFVGVHLFWNVLSVIAIGLCENISAKLIQESMSTFAGVKRRFNIEEDQDLVYIDDYAHHPTAIKVTIEAARVRYPHKKIVAIFKPDRYSRVAAFIQDFADSLNTADEVILCPFPENAKKEEGIDIDIYDLAHLLPEAQVMVENEANAAILAQEKEAVLLFMSSKDIYKFKDIVKKFHQS